MAILVFLHELLPPTNVPSPLCGMAIATGHQLFSTIKMCSEPTVWDGDVIGLKMRDDHIGCSEPTVWDGDLFHRLE